MKKKFTAAALGATMVLTSFSIGAGAAQAAEPPVAPGVDHGSISNEQTARPPIVIGTLVFWDWVDDSIIRQGQDEARLQSPAYQAAFREKLQKCIGSDPSPSSNKQQRCVNRAHRAGQKADTGYVVEDGMIPDFGGPIVRPTTP